MRKLNSRWLFSVVDACGPSIILDRRCSVFAKFQTKWTRGRIMESKQKGSSNGNGEMQAATAVSLNVLQNGSFGFYRSVYLATDNVTYMFNCPDTNQRLLSEQGLRRPPSIKHVFFTHGSWRNVSGLAGLASYLKSIRVRRVDLHGPPGLTRIVNVARSFHGLSVKVDSEKPTLEDEGLKMFEDSNVVVRCVPFSISEENGKMMEEYLERVRSDEGKTCPVRADQLAVAYICTIKPKWGKVRLEKCHELGVPVGPAIGLLQRGLVAKNRRGEEIHPDQVRDPPAPAQYLAVVECPDERYLPALLRSKPFTTFRRGDGDHMHLILHFSPKRVMDTEEYQRWMGQFSPSTIHWVCNDSSPQKCHFDGVLRAQMNMHKVHGEIFPKLWHQRMASDSVDDESAGVDVVRAEPFSKYSFRLSTGFQPINAEDGDRDSSAVGTQPEQTKALRTFREQCAEWKGCGEAYPTVTFLGTSSATPTKYRNVSSILLDIRRDVAVMLDCGESTVSQMQLLYGKDQFEQRLLAIKAVFISHLHSDHHFGLYSLILERKGAYDKLGKPYEKLIVLAASPLHRAHCEFSAIVEETVDLCQFYSTANDDKLVPSLATIADRVGLKEIRVVKVIHPQCATGFVMVTEDGKKVVYSGDTRPCQELAEMGRDADLLIHEATLNDGWETDAVFKKHCTKSEAIAVSRAMNAKWTILTHFTGLNAKLAYVDERILKENPNVGLACDFMTVRWEHLPLIPKIVPVLYEIHSDCVADQEGKFSRKRAVNEIEQDEQETARKEAKAK